MISAKGFVSIERKKIRRHVFKGNFSYDKTPILKFLSLFGSWVDALLLRAEMFIKFLFNSPLLNGLYPITIILTTSDSPDSHHPILLFSLKAQSTLLH